MAADSLTIGSALMEEVEGRERVIAYLSRKMLDPETRYWATEKLCLCVLFMYQVSTLSIECRMCGSF